ncbi:MAG TPA: hypothetical protein VIT42_08165 [Microlunatus sp.]
MADRGGHVECRIAERRRLARQGRSIPAARRHIQDTELGAHAAGGDQLRSERGDHLGIDGWIVTTGTNGRVQRS